jgi:HSP20 family protein
MSEKTENAVVRRHPFAELELWKPWEPLRSIMGEFFQDLPRDWPQRTGLAVPSVDITETEDEYHVRAELPGVSKDDVTVELEQGVLSIRGEKKTRRDEKAERGRRLECSYGAFSRTISLPQDADADRISAEFRDGVLEVAIGKRPESKPKQIAVKG